MRAAVGDKIVVKGHHVGDHGPRGNHPRRRGDRRWPALPGPLERRRPRGPVLPGGRCGRRALPSCVTGTSNDIPSVRHNFP